MWGDYMKTYLFCGFLLNNIILLNDNLLLCFFRFIYLLFCTCGWSMFAGQRTALLSVPSFHRWLRGMELRSPGLAVSSFIRWAILSAHGARVMKHALNLSSSHQILQMPVLLLMSLQSVAVERSTELGPPCFSVIALMCWCAVAEVCAGATAFFSSGKAISPWSLHLPSRRSMFLSPRQTSPDTLWIITHYLSHFLPCFKKYVHTYISYIYMFIS